MTGLLAGADVVLRDEGIPRKNKWSARCSPNHEQARPLEPASARKTGHASKNSRNAA